MARFVIVLGIVVKNLLGVARAYVRETRTTASALRTTTRITAIALLAAVIIICNVVYNSFCAAADTRIINFTNQLASVDFLFADCANTTFENTFEIAN